MQVSGYCVSCGRSYEYGISILELLHVTIPVGDNFALTCPFYGEWCDDSLSRFGHDHQKVCPMASEFSK
jgi:hypothetical protein